MSQEKVKIFYVRNSFFSDTHVSQFVKVTLKAGNYASDFKIQIIMKTSPALIEFK